MNGVHWLELLARHSHAGRMPSWDELVVGYDFGILSPEGIQTWVGRYRTDGPACQALLALEGDGMIVFEAALWDACVESTGKVPRPGTYRWQGAQDRWRLALLKDALEASLTPHALALAVEAIYSQVGCPEDMLELWKRTGPRGEEANLDAIGAFIDRHERRLAENGSGHLAESCYTVASAGV